MTAEHIHDALTLLPADLIAEVDRKRAQKPKRIVWKRYAAMAACFAAVLCGSLFCMRLFQLEKTSMAAAPAEAAVRQEQEKAYSFGGGTARPETEAAAAPAAEAPAEAEETLCGLPTAPVQEENGTEDIRADTTAGTICAGMSQPKYIEAVPASTTACFTGEPAPKLFRSRTDLESYRDDSIRFQPDNLMEACEGYDEAWFETHDLLLITLCGVPVSDRSEITAIRELVGAWEICVESYLDSTEAQRCDWHVLIETEKGLIADEDDILLVYE